MRLISLVLAAAGLAFSAQAAVDRNGLDWNGKKVSILGDSYSTYDYETEYTDHGVTYGLVAFTNTVDTFAWTVPAGITTVDILAVGGGGAGGAARYYSGYCGAAGGGAGAVIYKECLTVAGGQTFSVKVGKGGVGSTSAIPGDGESSWVTNATANIRLTAAGGGHGGGCVSAAGGAGGCGGGGYGSGTLGGLPNGFGTGTRGGTGVTLSGNRALGGGGGGAFTYGPAASSKNGGSGGSGLFCRITGASVCYGGGGGSGAAQADNGNSGAGGNGGGGKGGDEDEGISGTNGLGGGGGGGSSDKTAMVYAGGNGGSGVVYIRYVKNMGTAAVPSNLSPNGIQVNVHNAKQKEFLAMSVADIRTSFANGTWRGTVSKQGDCLPLPVTFSWNGGGINTVRIYNANGSLFLEKTVRGNSTEMWGFDIGTNYTWEVVNSVHGASARAAFTTEFDVPRMFRDPNFDEVTFDGSSTCTRKLTGVINMRELGGYTGLDGKKIKTGKLIRTARLTETATYSFNPKHEMGDTFVKTAAASNFWLNVLGVKTQVDLRDPTEYGDNYVGNESAGPLGPTVRWVKFTTPNSEQAVPCYASIFTDHGKASYKLVLDTILNPANHPVVFHCSAGKDRTGTVAYILESILGVSDEDKFRDWVALVLSSTDQQFSPTAYYDPFVAGFASYEGETQNDKVVSFVKSIGITDAQINTFRNAMLEGGYSDGSHVHSYGNWVTNTAPDCVTAGSRYRECVASGCDVPPDRINETIPALGHIWGGWVTNQVATVQATGERQHTCSRCYLVEKEVIPMLIPPSHPYTATWSGAAGDNAWGTAGNWDYEMTSADAAYFPISADISLPVNGTAGTAFTAGTGTYIKVTPGSGNTVQFNATTGETVLCEEGATVEATGPGGFRLSNPNGVFLRDNATVKATDGNYIKLSNSNYGAATNVAFIADGAGSQIKVEWATAHASTATSSDTFAGLNGGTITVSKPHILGAPHLHFENGGTLTSLFEFKATAPGASVVIASNSTVNVTSEDATFRIGDYDATMVLRGQNPRLVNNGWDSEVKLGSNLSLTLVPEPDWSATDGIIYNQHKYATVVIASGVKYIIDVSRLGNLAAPKTFCLVSSINTSMRNSTLPIPAAADITVVRDGVPVDYYDVEFSVDNASATKAMFITVTQTAEPPAVDPNEPTVAPSIISPNGVEVETHTALQKEFLAKTAQQRRDCFTNEAYRTALACDGLGGEPKKTTLEWTGDGLCTVTVKRASDNKTVFTTSLVGNTVDIDQLEIAGSYTWSVSNDLGTANGTFTTSAEAPRLLREPGSNDIRRVRDLGGRLGLGGKRVKQNLLFRSSQFNRNDNTSYITDDNRSFWLDFLGIRTDMDLRSDGEKGSNWQNSSPLGNSVNYVKPDVGSYQGFFTNPTELKVLFNALFNTENYPMVFHCVAGRDRTGVVAYFINALLGVDEDELIKDWEANAFADSDLNFNHTYLDTFRNNLAAYAPTGTPCEQAYNALISLDYTSAQINAFRNFMLEGGYEPPAPPEPPVDDSKETFWTGAVNANLTEAGNWTKGVPSSTQPGAVRDGETANITLNDHYEIDPWDGGSTSYFRFGTNTTTYLNANGNGFFCWHAKEDHDLFCPGATVVVTNGNGTDENLTVWGPNNVYTKGGKMYSDSTIRAEDGGVVNLGVVKLDPNATNVTFSVGGDAGSAKSKMDVYMYDYPTANNKDIRFIADGNGQLVFQKQRVSHDGDRTWNPPAGSSVTIIARNGGIVDPHYICVDGCKLTIVAENAGTSAVPMYFDGLHSVAAGSSLVISNTYVKSSFITKLGTVGDTYLEFAGDAPVLYNGGGMSPNNQIGQYATIKLAPTPNWSATEGVIRNHYAMKIDGAVHYIVDVSALPSGSFTNTFRMASGDRAVTFAAPSADNVSVVGGNPDEYTVTFAANGSYNVDVRIEHVASPVVLDPPVIGGDGGAGITIADGYANIRITNPGEGIKYGYKKSTDLQTLSAAPIVWLDVKAQPDSTDLILPILLDANESRCFIRVVSDYAD